MSGTRPLVPAAAVAGGDQRRRRQGTGMIAALAVTLLAITVVAGFASTTFMPLTGWLVGQHGWRAALLVLAAVQAATVPMHAALVRRPAPPTVGPDGSPQAVDRFRPVVRAVLADRGFWLLAAGFTAHTAAISALTVHLVAALVSWGHPPASPPRWPGCSVSCR
ncbi:MFS transporter [Plantactinospora endophytica]|uniref:Major facilitator superfamily (MFS) profile domain-containing protein n=1 Tax=Plantactinospora endophytica TaxID=673535 RepID=A0ABQ4E7I1_9ACTN|nr:MFS transporter [Plantactinospora endophytica]GIG90672.1 hypothetical protein Pen02_56080 [Plantactinospora endophytica]